MDNAMLETPEGFEVKEKGLKRGGSQKKIKTEGDTEKAELAQSSNSNTVD